MKLHRFHFFQSSKLFGHHLFFTPLSTKHHNHTLVMLFSCIRLAFSVWYFPKCCVFWHLTLVSELLLRFLKCCWVFEISSCFTERCCLFNFVDMFLKCSKMAPRGHRIYLPAVSKNWRENLILIINNKDYICSFISGIADERISTSPCWVLLLCFGW